MPAWIDVSMPLFTGTVAWPGDPKVRLGRVHDVEKGAPCTLSAVTLCAHSGTHMDAPSHFIGGAAAMDDLPFDVCMGRARVIEIEDPVSIGPGELARHHIRRGERILFKTANSSRPWNKERFDEDFVHISPEGARFLAGRAVRLVGVDYLSVGGFRTDGAATHRALLEAGVWLLEGLDLSRAEPGPVELVCLPLRLAGAEGAPARALVRQVTSRTGRRA
jgi:arylformamidase